MTDTSVRLPASSVARARSFAEAHAKAHPEMTAPEIGREYRGAFRATPAMERRVTREVRAYRRRLLRRGI